MKSNLTLLCFLLVTLCCLDTASPAENIVPAERTALWTEPAPIGDGATEEANAFISVHSPAKPNGTAIIICPGGGYGGLVVGSEGHGIAEWLNKHGITGVVLEYRLPKGRHPVPLLDAQRAIRTVRANSQDWDSTRIVTMMVDAFATPVFKLHKDQNTTDGYHNLSHHGQAEEKIAQLLDADHQQMVLLRHLMQDLASQRDGDQRLLDRTMILYGSNMGDANTHDNSNLPIMLAGGGFKHGQHIAFNRKNNKPLCNLYVSMLQQLGVEVDQFGSSDGSLSGLV